MPNAPKDAQRVFASAGGLQAAGVFGPSGELMCSVACCWSAGVPHLSWTATVFDSEEECWPRGLPARVGATREQLAWPLRFAEEFP